MKDDAGNDNVDREGTNGLKLDSKLDECETKSNSLQITGASVKGYQLTQDVR